MLSAVRHLTARAGLAALHGRRFGRFRTAAESPEDIQHMVLAKILAANADTAFGKRHGFGAIRNAADYRHAVPVQTYEDLRPDIEAQESTGEPRLTSERSVYYNRTSGTVAAPKNIPVTATGLRRIRSHQRLGAYTFAKLPGLLGGKLFAVTGAAVEGHMPGGTPFGSASGLLYRNQPKLLSARYVLPAGLSEVEDYDARYLGMAAYGIAEPGVTCAATPNSSTLLRLLDLVNRRPDDVLRLVSDGYAPTPDQPAIAPLRPQPRRAKVLSAAYEANGGLTYADVWPGLAGLVTWTGGSCGLAIERLTPALPKGCAILELGYVASEVHGTANVDVRRNACLPTLHHTFFEFVEREAWEEGNRDDVLGLADLEIGQDYYVLVTTADGLYRYDMNDIMRVDGRIGPTPTLEFVQKGKGVTSITGEKLYESQVLDAVRSSLAERGLHAVFFIVLADAETPGYTLYVEPADRTASDPQLSGGVDAGLRAANIEYDGKRGSGRLEALRVRSLKPGTGEAFRAQRVAAGQRDAQFKYLHLQYADECSFDFESASRSDALTH